MRRLLLLIPLLAACAGRAQTSTIPTTGSFVDALPTDALAYLAIDVAQLRDDPEFATLFAPRLGEASASEQALFRGVFASVDSIAVAVMPRAGDIPSPIVGIVHTSMDTAAVAALAEASGARVTRQARDGHDVLALSMGGAQTIDAVACEAGRFVVGVGVDVVAACEGFPRTTAGPAFARVVAEYARTPRPAIIHTLDAPCGTEVLEPYLLAGTKAQAPSDVRFGLCAMSLSFAFGDGLDVAGELVFDDVLRLAEFERMLAQLLRGLGDRYTRALAPLRASLATRPTNGERAFTVDFTEADVADMITMRAQLMQTRASDEMRFDTPMAEVFAAIDARAVWRTEPAHDRLVRTGDAPKGLLLYLPDADEGTDVPENVLALARAGRHVFQLRLEVEDVGYRHQQDAPALGHGEVAAGLGRQPGQRLARRRRGTARLLQGCGQPLRPHGLDQVVDRIQLERLHGILVVGRREHHRRRMRRAGQMARQLDAVHLRHADVHQRHVGGRVGQALQRLDAMGRFADDDVGQFGGNVGQQRLHARPRRRLVVDDEDSQRIGIHALPPED